MARGAGPTHAGYIPNFYSMIRYLVPGVYFRFGVYRRAKRFSLWEAYRFPCIGLAHGVPNLGGLFGNGSAVTSFQ